VWVEYRLSIVIKLDMKIDLKINSYAANTSARP